MPLLLAALGRPRSLAPVGLAARLALRLGLGRLGTALGPSLGLAAIGLALRSTLRCSLWLKGEIIPEHRAAGIQAARRCIESPWGLPGVVHRLPAGAFGMNLLVAIKALFSPVLPVPLAIAVAKAARRKLSAVVVAPLPQLGPAVLGGTGPEVLAGLAARMKEGRIKVMPVDVKVMDQLIRRKESQIGAMAVEGPEIAAAVIMQEIERIAFEIGDPQAIDAVDVGIADHVTLGIDEL
ncbi:MAG: hypothetical protein V3U44_06060, partial [Alphaproteobacteria bacterium]